MRGDWISGGQHRAALAHRDVVRGIEAHGREVAEGADVLPAVGRAQGVAVVLDQPEIVLLAIAMTRRDRTDCRGCARA